LENLPLANNSRILKYGSFGIANIVFPYEHILKRAVERIVKENFVDKNRLSKPDLSDIPVIKEEDFLETQRYRDIETKFLGGRKNIEEASKREVSEVIENAKWNRYDIWRDNFSGYREEIEEKIKKTLATNKENLKNQVKEKISTLHFKEVKN